MIVEDSKLNQILIPISGFGVLSPPGESHPTPTTPHSVPFTARPCCPMTSSVTFKRSHSCLGLTAVIGDSLFPKDRFYSSVYIKSHFMTIV